MMKVMLLMLFDRLNQPMAHRDPSCDAVRKFLVLLKNGKDPKKPFLPLDNIAKKILIAGTHADDLGYQCGGWTCIWIGLSGVQNEERDEENDKDTDLT
ncbi:hypothetical protein BC332_02628 [Capsicum chinense]|nr:hypothetical protein BC332_02628 [Capsicum chinense]